MSLDEQIANKKKELEEVRKIEKDKLDKIELDISGKQFSESKKKLESNAVDKYENNVSTLATDLRNATESLESFKIQEGKEISGNLLKDLMNTKNDLRKQELTNEEEKILKEFKIPKRFHVCGVIGLGYKPEGYIYHRRPRFPFGRVYDCD